MRDKDTLGTTYFGNGDFYEEKGRVESAFKVNGFQVKYYLFVKNNGKGTATIERK